MDQTIMEQPIVAICCEDRHHNIRFIHLKPHTTFDKLTFTDESLQIGNLLIHFKWYNNVVVCTEETLQQITKELQNAQ